MRIKVDELDRIRGTSLGPDSQVFDLADDITSMLHQKSGPPSTETTVRYPLAFLIG